MTETTLGQRIAERRKLLGLSQEAFGEKMGVSRQAASKWEADAATPELEKLVNMSKLFGVSVGWLLGAEETSPEAALQPEDAPVPPKRAAKWPLGLCAGVTAVSLLVAIPTLIWGGQSQARVTELAKENQRLAAQLADAGTRLESMESSLQSQGDEMIALHDQISGLEKKNQTLTRQLEDAKETITDEAEQWTEQTFPGTDTSARWVLSAQAASSLDSVELRLSCTLDAALGVRGAAFHVRRNGETVATVQCQQYAPVYTAALELAPADGYVYDLVLIYADGTQGQIELNGHGFSDLETELRFGRRVVLRNDKVTMGGQKFWLTYEDVTLMLPSLLPADVRIKWSGMKLVYYYEGEAVEEKDLTETMDKLSLNEADYLSFSQPTLTFTMPGKEDGTRHEIWLEGTVSIDGAENPVRILLTRCKMEQGLFVLSDI